MPEQLTARRLETVKPPEKGQAEIMDREQRGLCFRLTAKGERAWYLRIKVDGRSRRFVIGPYPEISLAEARKRASRLRLEVLEGADPIEDRRKAKAHERAALKVQDVLEIYADAHLMQKKDGAKRLQKTRNGLGPLLELPISEISRADLIARIDAKAKTAPIAANRLRAYLHHFFRWAESREYIPLNPASGIEPVSIERPRDRVLSLDEIASIWHASEKLGPVWRAFVRISILTAQRQGELSQMRWDDLKGDTYEIPAARTKTDSAHIVHLSAPVIRELEALRAERDGSDLVFTNNGDKPISSFSRAKARLDELSGVTDWRFHDLRTAFASNMAEAGESEGVVDRVLNHAASASRVSTVARVYQRSALLPQRARCLDRWADAVLRAAGERDGAEIVRIGSGA